MNATRAAAALVLVLGLSASGAAAPPYDGKPLTIGDVKGVSGQAVRGVLKVAEEADGSPVALPLVIVSGTKPGPVVWVEASTHGDEYGGVRALQRLLRTVNPKALSGTVVAVMVSNPPAFRGLQRVNPSLDDLADMGDVFPGKERFATERIAAAVNAEVRRSADYFVDLHTGGDRFRQCPFVFYSPTGSVLEARYDALARGFGVPILWRDTDKVFAHDAVTTFSGVGIPSFLLEVGGGQPLAEEDLNLQSGAVARFLQTVGALAGTPPPAAGFSTVTGYRIVTNARGGFFEATVRPCDRIHEGSVLGIIVDVYGDTVETLKAPAGADIVLGVSTYPATPTGGWLLELGTGLAPVPAPAR